MILGQKKISQRDVKVFSDTISSESDFLEGEMAMNDLKCQKMLRNSEEFYKNHFAELPGILNLKYLMKNTFIFRFYVIKLSFTSYYNSYRT